MRAAPAAVGDPVASIDTPALVVELDAFERNLRRMADFARSRGLKLRPHAKTHKSAAVALQQTALGAVGVCVQKVGEAEALVAGGVKDVFLSNQVIDPAKLARLARLARRASIGIAVDSVLGVERLAAAVADAGSAVGVLVEVDVGQGRCGVTAPQVVGLAQRVLALRGAGLRFAGVHAYHGGAQHLRGLEERAAAIDAAAATAARAVQALESVGIACPLVTGAGTGTFPFEAASGVYGELQPGSYVFMDADYLRNTPHPESPRFEPALFVKAQVMSRAPRHAVLDAGHKSHAIESGLPTVWSREDLRVASANDEHAVLVLADAAESALDRLPALGESVWLVPGHCDPTVNLHDHLVAVRGGLHEGRVEALWAVDARGAVD